MARAQAEADSARFWLWFIRLLLGGFLAVGSGALAGVALWYFAGPPQAVPDVGATLLTAGSGAPSSVTLVPAPQSGAAGKLAGAKPSVSELPAAETMAAPGKLDPPGKLDLAGKLDAPGKLNAPVPAAGESDGPRSAASVLARRRSAAQAEPSPPPFLVPDASLQLSWMEEPPLGPSPPTKATEPTEPTESTEATGASGATGATGATGAPAGSTALATPATSATPAATAEPPAAGDQLMRPRTSREIDAGLAALDLDALGPSEVAPANPPAWRRHAVKVSKPIKKPAIAIVIDDLGLNRPNTRRTIALPGPLTLALMTYAETLQEFADRARANGHELMVHFPMAPRDPRYDPGPNVLSAELEQEELARRLDWGLSRFEGYVGINNHMGSGFTTSIPGMAQVMLELKARGLLYLDSLTVPGAVGAQLADRLGVPFAQRDIFIDNDHEDPESIRRQLARLERIARRRGAAIAIGHPHDETIEVLAAWLPEVQKRGFTLVPVSALIQTPSGLAVTPKRADGPG